MVSRTGFRHCNTTEIQSLCLLWRYRVCDSSRCTVSRTGFRHGARPFDCPHIHFIYILCKWATRYICDPRTVYYQLIVLGSDMVIPLRCRMCGFSFGAVATGCIGRTPCLHIDVCMFSHVWWCKYHHICVHMCVCVYTYVCVYMYIYTHVYMCICTHTHLYKCLFVCVYMCAYIYIYICTQYCTHWSTLTSHTHKHELVLTHNIEYDWILSCTSWNACNICMSR